MMGRGNFATVLNEPRFWAIEATSLSTGWLQQFDITLTDPNKQRALEVN